MKRLLWMSGLVLVAAAVPLAAQTRVSVAIGVGVPAPYPREVVEVDPPYWYGRPRVVYVVPWWHRYRRPFVVGPRVWVGRRHWRRHWRDWGDRDDDDDRDRW